jgi:hypothetical protein
MGKRQQFLCQTVSDYLVITVLLSPFNYEESKLYFANFLGANTVFFFKDLGGKLINYLTFFPNI